MQHSKRFLDVVEDALTRVREISPEDTLAKQERGESFLLIDTREDSEWAAGHIKGAIHVGRGVIERDIEKLAPELGTELVLYCGGGFRSALAADMLQKMGYTNVTSMADGWRGWKERQFPIEG